MDSTKKRKLNCTSQKLKSILLGIFPFILHLKEYNWRTDFVRDLVAGLCSGVIHVPQGMGFALLANVPPIYGLYTSILPGWLYYVFGTSKHLSFGTMAVTALMVGGFVNSQISPETVDIIDNDALSNLTRYNVSIPILNNSFEFEMNKSELSSNGFRNVNLASSVTLLCGFIQLGLALLNGGLLASFMSLPFISGFTTASALHITVAQVPFMLGINIKRSTGIFQLPLTVVSICSVLKTTNICSLISSLISCLFLIITKELINEKFKSRMPIPIPSELLVVAIATVVTKFSQLHERWGVRIVGSIPMGLPVPIIPSVLSGGSQFFFGTLVQALPIAIVGFSFAVTMAKLMAERHDYVIRPNQELLACACANTIPAFFGCFAATQAPPRTMVHDSTQCRSQLAGLLSTLLPLLVILCLAPFLTHLPLNALGSVCFCALLPIMKEFKQIKFLWKASRFDCVVWVISFLATLLLSITYGLVIGILISCAFILHLLRSTKPSVRVHRLTGDHHRHATVFKIAESLCFVNVDGFKRAIMPYTKASVDKIESRAPGDVEGDNALAIVSSDDVADDRGSSSDRRRDNVEILDDNKADAKSGLKLDLTKFHLKDDSKSEDGEKRALRVFAGALDAESTQSCPHLLVVDCSRLNFIDSLGVSALRKVYVEASRNGVDLKLTSCAGFLAERLIGTTGSHDLAWKFCECVEEAVGHK